MSVRTAAKSFEHKSISNNHTPQPYSGSKKPKTLEKPSLLGTNNTAKNNNNNSVSNGIETNKPIFPHASELSSFKFKDKTASLNNRGSANNQDKKHDESKTEFQSVALKKNTAKPTAPPPTVAKKPPPATIYPPPPTDDELRVTVVEDKSESQLKNELELKKLPSGSVRNSKLMLLEKLTGANHDGDPVPIRRRTSTNGSNNAKKNSRTNSIISNSSTDSGENTGDCKPVSSAPSNSPRLSTFKVGQKQQQPPPVQMKKPTSLPKPLILESNPVSSVVSPNNNNKNSSRSFSKKNSVSSRKQQHQPSTVMPAISPSPSVVVPETTNININYDEQESNYDDVKTPISPTGPAPIAFAAPIAPPLLKNIDNSNNLCNSDCDQIYDDVNEQNNGGECIYDDVNDTNQQISLQNITNNTGSIAPRPTPRSLPHQQEPHVIQSQNEETYDDVSNITATTVATTQNDADGIYDDVDSVTKVD